MYIPFRKKAKKKLLHLFSLSDAEAVTWLMSQDFQRNIARFEARAGNNRVVLLQISNLKKLRRACMQAQVARIFFRTVAIVGTLIGVLGTLGVVGLDFAFTGGSFSAAGLIGAAAANHTVISSLSAVAIASLVVGYAPTIFNKISKLISTSRKDKLTKVILSIHSSIRSTPEQLDTTFSHILEAPAALGNWRKRRYVIGRAVNRSLAEINCAINGSRVPQKEISSSPLITLKYSNCKSHRLEKIQSTNFKTEGEAGVDAFIEKLKGKRLERSCKQPKIILLHDPRNTTFTKYHNQSFR